MAMTHLLHRRVPLGFLAAQLGDRGTALTLLCRCALRARERNSTATDRNLMEIQDKRTALKRHIDTWQGIQDLHMSIVWQFRHSSDPGPLAVIIEAAASPESLNAPTATETLDPGSSSSSSSSSPTRDFGVPLQALKAEDVQLWLPSALLTRLQAVLSPDNHKITREGRVRVGIPSTYTTQAEEMGNWGEERSKWVTGSPTLVGSSQWMAMNEMAVNETVMNEMAMNEMAADETAVNETAADKTANEAMKSEPASAMASTTGFYMVVIPCSDEHRAHQCIAQADDALEDICRLRRILTGIADFKQLNINSTGQHTIGRTRSLFTKFQEKGGSWESRLRILNDMDIRGPGGNSDEYSSKGHYEILWIWLVPRSSSDGTVLLDGIEGEINPEELLDNIKVEWAQNQARVERWGEEVTLLEEEMRRVIEYLSGRQGGGANSPANTRICWQRCSVVWPLIFELLALQFADLWVPYLQQRGNHTVPAWGACYLTAQQKKPARTVMRSRTMPATARAGTSVSTATVQRALECSESEDSENGDVLCTHLSRTSRLD
ncbi:hypothetical protein L226DRAFT_527495 [Lentinus tigrinus ALCF2SS1-7]|uniref:Uncharacterized protein n=1 Tax=Lentinus tigrinus ALCF2SS1-6 TaxID=1328759 RepID=A0A5C2RNH9_9APHY|nr:hypothetical protein L227DRAFT_568430 [Lentinus tigrinus ALCF2SS1-6]RPD68015.1 hypothetical protein L226DRAFT_527495 [Lentinus tigrinus ALCF2SS1-7]